MVGAGNSEVGEEGDQRDVVFAIHVRVEDFCFADSCTC